MEAIRRPPNDVKELFKSLICIDQQMHSLTFTGQDLRRYLFLRWLSYYISQLVRAW